MNPKQHSRWRLALWLAILMAAGTSGACRMSYSKPGQTQEQFARDEYDCRIATGPYSHNLFMAREMLDQCMRQKGYRRE